MKKILYAILFSVTLATTLSACTEENVAPKTNEGGSGTPTADPKG
jgi:hypothetical protein